MASKKNNNEATEQENTAKALTETTQQENAVKISTESVYSVEELAENSVQVFGSSVRSECVMAAFRSIGKDTATMTEAKKIVETFMKREVK